MEMEGCTGFMGSTIAGLKSLEFLDVAGCSQTLILAAGAAHLPIGDKEQEL